MQQQPSSLQKIITGLIIFSGLGILGALPAGMIALMGGSQLAGDIYLLAMLVLSTWFPLKVLVDRYIKGQSEFGLPNIKLNILSLTILGFGSIIMIPILYMMTLTAFLVGIFAYIFAGNSLTVALLAAFIMQIFSLYRSAQREKELGVNNNLFVRFQDMNMSANYDISIDAESSRAAEQPFDDTPDVLFLPSERLQQFDDFDDDDHMTITIDPDDSQSEQDES